MSSEIIDIYDENMVMNGQASRKEAHLNGYWQGMYQWANLECLEEYKKSLVFRVMNKRAIPESISTEHFVDSDLDPFVKDRLIT